MFEDVAIPDGLAGVDAAGEDSTVEDGGPQDVGPDDVALDVVNAADVSEPADIPDVPAEPVIVELIDMFGFSQTPGEQDPWFGDGVKATEELCVKPDWFAETTPDGDWFDVRTDFCSYVTVSQELTVFIPEGALIEVDILHFLITEGETPWTLAIGMGTPGLEVWSTEITVPQVMNSFSDSWTTDRDYEAGECVYFHVSNHGANVWTLTGLTATF
jgi:hypothetical protein